MFIFGLSKDSQILWWEIHAFHHEIFADRHSVFSNILFQTSTSQNLSNFNKHILIVHPIEERLLMKNLYILASTTIKKLQFRQTCILDSKYPAHNRSIDNHIIAPGV